VLLDTSTLVEIFRNPSESAVIEDITTKIGDEEAYISVIQVGEIADWATRNKTPPEERVEAAKELARIVPLSERICLDAAEFKRDRRTAGYKSFGLIDGVILATARSMGQRVLTFDRDFKGEKDCILLSLRP
jgi:predicted nucleic acid-binding protein